MVSRYIKSIWQSNSTLQAKTKAMTFISTADEQLHDWKPLLKEGIDTSFTNLVNLITVAILLITSLVISLLILIYGLGTSLATLVTKIIENGQRR